MTRAKTLVTRRVPKSTAKNGGPWSLTRAGIDLVRDMAAGGKSKRSIARALGVSHVTFRRMQDDDERVAEAVELGYAEMEDELVDILMTKARDPKNKGSTTAAIFLLKSRRGYEIGQSKVPQHLTVVNNDNRQQHINLPASEDMDEYMRRIGKIQEDARDA